MEKDRGRWFLSSGLSRPFYRELKTPDKGSIEALAYLHLRNRRKWVSVYQSLKSLPRSSAHIKRSDKTKASQPSLTYLYNILKRSLCTKAAHLSLVINTECLKIQIKKSCVLTHDCLKTNLCSGARSGASVSEDAKMWSAHFLVEQLPYAIIFTNDVNVWEPGASVIKVTRYLTDNWLFNIHNGVPCSGSSVCLITSMRNGRHEVLSPINHNCNKICDILGLF